MSLKINYLENLQPKTEALEPLTEENLQPKTEALEPLTEEELWWVVGGDDCKASDKILLEDEMDEM